jgi:hypothetical protein
LRDGFSSRMIVDSDPGMPEDGPSYPCLHLQPNSSRRPLFQLRRNERRPCDYLTVMLPEHFHFYCEWERVVMCSRSLRNGCAKPSFSPYAKSENALSARRSRVLVRP